MLALIKKENGALVVAQIYNDAVDGKADLYMNTVNLLEVYYVLIKAFDVVTAYGTDFRAAIY